MTNNPQPRSICKLCRDGGFTISPCPHISESKGKCCNTCYDSSLSFKKPCLSELCSCHTIPVSKGEEYTKEDFIKAEDFGPPITEDKKCGRCKQPFKGGTYCPHTPPITEASWGKEINACINIQLEQAMKSGRINKKIDAEEIFIRKEIILDFFRQTLTREIEKSGRCNKEIHGNAVCGVKLDCHLHDWREGRHAVKVYDDEIQIRLKDAHQEGYEEGLKQGDWNAETLISARQSAFHEAITLIEEALKPHITPSMNEKEKATMQTVKSVKSIIIAALKAKQ